MAKNSNITVDVYANLAVSDETCMRCARLIEMWMDDNPDATLVCDTVLDMDRLHHKLRIERESLAEVEK